jgi:hypothetical protein
VSCEILSNGVSYYNSWLSFCCEDYKVIAFLIGCMVEHWQQSAGYAGISMFAISLVWIFMGFTFAIVVSCMYFCWKDHLKPNPEFGRYGNWMTIIFMITFAIVTMYAIDSPQLQIRVLPLKPKVVFLKP